MENKSIDELRQELKEAVNVRDRLRKLNISSKSLNRYINYLAFIITEKRGKVLFDNIFRKIEGNNNYSRIIVRV